MAEKRKKTAQIHVRTFPNYKTMIEILAQATNMSVNEFILKETLDGTIEIFQLEEIELLFTVFKQMADVQYELNQIGNNLNQITRILNLKSKNDEYDKIDTEIQSLLELKVQLYEVLSDFHQLINQDLPIFKELGKNLRHKEIQCSIYAKEDEEAIQEIENITEQIDTEDTIDYRKRLNEIFERVKSQKEKGLLTKVQEEGYESFEEATKELEKKEKTKKEKFDGYQTEVDPENPFSGGII